MSYSAELGAFIARAGHVVAGLDVRLSPLHILGMALIAAFLYWRRGITEPFVAWLFPAAIYRHRSHLVDIKLFIVGRALALLGVINAFAVTTFATATALTAVGGVIAAESAWHPLLITVVVVLANDFSVYWVHRMHHESGVLWPFHAVHHSAEVLTPVTAYRKHPVYDCISQVVRSCIVGALQGVLLGLFVGKLELTTIVGTNALYFAFNFLGSNLRHTHIWISYGPLLERILIAPAQHQIHHSLELKHRNKNYGEIFALWDWAFGTLYVTSAREGLAFGISDDEGVAIPQPHGTLGEALVVPFRDSWRALRGDTAPETAGTPTTSV
jgi:sterol desaturase/sphingolipid hydroxylase (fatty acid hydroxylase superfamily)